MTAPNRDLSTSKAGSENGDMTNKLRELLAGATPGPWAVQGRWLHGAAGGPKGGDEFGTGGIADIYTTGTTTNAELIVAAVNALPALLDVVDAAEALTQVDVVALPEGGYLVPPSAGDLITRIAAALATADPNGNKAQ